MGEYTPDFDGDDDRETESLIGRAVERSSRALDDLQKSAESFVKLFLVVKEYLYTLTDTVIHINACL